MFNLLPVKNIKILLSSVLTVFAVLAVFVVMSLISSISTSAFSSDTSSFVSKIVYKVDGTNITNITPPACIVAGDANDTCDFEIRYYSAATGGTLRGTEVFPDVEIGQYDGVHNLNALVTLPDGSITSVIVVEIK